MPGSQNVFADTLCLLASLDLICEELSACITALIVSLLLHILPQTHGYMQRSMLVQLSAGSQNRWHGAEMAHAHCGV